jgi:radical SAM superfamily enzyme YgiQ (UPF0313 family)
MKIMFAVPPFHRFQYFVPYGISVVATVAKSAGLDVKVLFAYEDETNASFFTRMEVEIKRQNIDVVATGGHSVHYTLFEQLIGVAKSTGVITVFGGIIVDSLPEIVAENIGADYCVYGEGEHTFVELIQALDSNLDISKVPGLIFFRNGHLIKTPLRKCLPNLNMLPFIDGDLCHYGYSLQHSSIFPMELSRSCPNNCTFCYKIKGSRYRTKTLDRFFKELDHNLTRYGNKIETIHLMDDLFCANKPRLLEFCNRFAKYGLLLSLYVHASFVDEECIIALKKAGMKRGILGIESANNKVLASMNKRLSVERVEEVLYLAKKHDLVLSGSLIIGDIEDDLSTIGESEAFYYKHICNHNMRITMLRVYPGSHLYSYALKNEIIGDELEFLKNGCPSVNVSKIPEHVYRLLTDKYIAYESAKPATRQLLVHNREFSFSVGVDGSWKYLVCKYMCFCSKCYATLEITINSKSAVYGYQCPNCFIGLTMGESVDNHITPDFSSSVHLIHNLSEIIFHRYIGNRIVIWGINDVIRLLIIGSQTLRDMLVKLVDINYQGFVRESYCGLSVEHPDTLEGFQFDYIISPTVARRGEVLQALNDMGITEPKFIEIEASLMSNE